ncbi:P-loop containing nucleoside triphosphate hydrolase protein [Tricladium varicosporioides]|nr:P-loop containing nucleoside triphosphate hydrolase protein [Hymenoscyphus varicosporioides]
MAKESLEFLKVVEYAGPNVENNCYSTRTANINVQIYQIFNNEPCTEGLRDMPEGEIIYLPHVKFDRCWDDLIFDEDYKRDLIWTMTNMLRFSKNTTSRSRDMNPIIMLYGPPGTGKTTLCQGLAQKISIRLSSGYEQVKLIQIKTATLLSKYYSESAKIIDQIFSTIVRECQDEPMTFLCILIDEVESIAFSRELSTSSGECQDSLRATNALLTGLDRTRKLTNLLYLCTSNMVDQLDTAFVDRCGLKLFVGSPSPAAQYVILSRRIQSLVDRGLIRSDEMLPPYKVAFDTAGQTNKETPGTMILEVVDLLNQQIVQTSPSDISISGRALAQLPEQSILRYLRDEICDIKTALGFIKRFVLSQHQPSRSAQGGNQTEVSTHMEQQVSGEDSESDLQVSTPIKMTDRKRKLKIMITLEDYDMETLGQLEEFLSSVRGPGGKRSCSTQQVKEEPQIAKKLSFCPQDSPSTTPTNVEESQIGTHKE